MRIFKTGNYNGFKILDGNRDVNQAHVKKLMESISKDNMLEANPIIVTEDGTIIDGQHRFTACQNLGLPIYYVQMEGDLETVQMLNTNSKSWTITDYVESYIKLGRGEYEALRDFRDRWGVPYGTSASLLYSGQPRGGRDVSNIIQSGNFKIRHSVKAAEIMTWVSAFEGYADKIIIINREFINAVCTIMNSKQVSLSHLKHKLQVFGGKLNRAGLKNDYLRQIEEIVNFKSKTEKVRFF